MQLVLLAALASIAAAPDTLVVCPPVLQPSLAPWLEHRREEGRVIEVVAPSGTAEEVRTQIQSFAAGGKLQFVVLVGDAPEQREIALRGRPRPTVPTFFVEAKVNVRFGSEREIATDNPYADLDGDDVPELAIGRLTADSPEDLSRIVKKILAYEKSLDYSLWRSKINFVAGVGGFGILADAVLEATTQQVIMAGIPAAYATTMTHASWRSPYCPDPRTFHNTVLDRLNEGCLFWVYIGHGHRWMLDRVQTPRGEHHILDIRDMHKFGCERGAPIALFLACYTAAFDGQQDCLAEEMLRTEGAPVAILGGSRVTMPYAMSVMGTGMMDEFFTNGRQTVGELLLHAKRYMMVEEPTSDLRAGIDAIASALNPADLKAERQEHLQLFNLIGDPLLRVRQPQPMELNVASEAVAGDIVRLTGRCDVDGPCRVEVVPPRGRLKQRAPSRGSYPNIDAQLADYSATYAQSNNQQHVSADVVVRNGVFTVDLEIPGTARGPVHVRAFVQGDRTHAMGTAELRVVAPADAPPQEQGASAATSLRR